MSKRYWILFLLSVFSLLPIIEAAEIRYGLTGSELPSGWTIFSSEIIDDETMNFQERGGLRPTYGEILQYQTPEGDMPIVMILKFSTISDAKMYFESSMRDNRLRETSIDIGDEGRILMPREESISKEEPGVRWSAISIFLTYRRGDVVVWESGFITTVGEQIGTGSFKPLEIYAEKLDKKLIQLVSPPLTATPATVPATILPPTIGGLDFSKIAIALGAIAVLISLTAVLLSSKRKGDLGRDMLESKIVKKGIVGPEVIVSVSGLSKKYKTSEILKDVSFDVKQGSLCSIVGPSGGGKSTVIESLSGRLSPDSGTVELLGKDVAMSREDLNKFIGFVPQHPELYLDQSVWSNMINSAIKWEVEDAKAKSEKILKQLGILDRKDVIAKNLSGGQLKRLSLGMELIREPPLLILDEPTTGLDPTSRDQILSALSHLVSTEKKTVLFSTHFMDEAEHCDEVIILGNAQILAKGPPSELARKMPGRGKVVHIILEAVSEDLVSKVSGLGGVKKVIREGRVLKFIMDSPKPIEISQKIEEFGGVIEEAKIAKAGMKEVFVYYTGVYPEDVE